ncbi:MAG: STAS domain-containing protein [Solirubrobacterales bacterium]
MTDLARPMTVRAPAHGVSVIEITGEITRESDRALRDAYDLAADGAVAIILAFDELEYMSSSGIGLLVTLRPASGPSQILLGRTLLETTARIHDASSRRQDARLSSTATVRGMLIETIACRANGKAFCGSVVRVGSAQATPGAVSQPYKCSRNWSQLSADQRSLASKDSITSSADRSNRRFSGSPNSRASAASSSCSRSLACSFVAP